MSIYDNIAFGVKLFESLNATDMDDRVEWALRKAALWNEVKDKLNQSGSSLSAANSSACALRAALPSSPKCCCSTSLARRWTRSHRQGGRADCRAEERLHRGHRDAQHAASCALQRLHRLCTWAIWWSLEKQSRCSSNPSARETEDYITGRFG